VTKPKKDDLGPELEKAIKKMLVKMNDEGTDMELRLKVFTAASKFYQIKMRLSDEGLGAGFRDEEEQE
jgi:ribosomal protein L13